MLLLGTHDGGLKMRFEGIVSKVANLSEDEGLVCSEERTCGSRGCLMHRRGESPSRQASSTAKTRQQSESAPGSSLPLCSFFCSEPW